MEKPTSTKEREFVRVRITRRENEGQDIIIPDERGIDWQIIDGSAVRIPKACYANLLDAVTERHIKDKKTGERKIVKQTRYILQLLRDDEPLDGETDGTSEIMEAAISDAEKIRGNRANGAEVARSHKVDEEDDEADDSVNSTEEDDINDI